MFRLESGEPVPPEFLDQRRRWVAARAVRWRVGHPVRVDVPDPWPDVSLYVGAAGGDAIHTAWAGPNSLGETEEERQARRPLVMTLLGASESYDPTLGDLIAASGLTPIPVLETVLGALGITPDELRAEIGGHDWRRVLDYFVRRRAGAAAREAP